jgi:hypothetical protein
MDWLMFVDQLIGSLAWPVAVIIVVLILRTPLSHVIESLRRLTYKEWSLDFAASVDQLEAQADREGLPRAASAPTLGEQPESPGAVQSFAVFDEEIAALAELSPLSAVMRAWVEIENAINRATTRLGIPVEPHTTSWESLKSLSRRGFYDSPTFSTLEQMRRLRNAVAHGGADAAGELTYESAVEYAQLAKRVIRVLDSFEKPSTSPASP